LDPDVSFEEFNFAVAQAWVARQKEKDLGGYSVDKKRRLLELGEKRLQLVLAGVRSTESEKSVAEKHLTSTRAWLATLATAPDLVFTLPVGEPAELMRRAGEADDPKLGPWMRG